MKKIFILSFLTIILLTGCGVGTTKTMICSYDTSNNIYTSNMTYNILHDDDEVKKVRIMYSYKMRELNSNDAVGTDGVGTGTDGTTSDTQIDKDGIVDGVVGSAIDNIINSFTDTVMDMSGIRLRHDAVQDTYRSVTGFSIQNTDDMTTDSYKVSYIIDYDTISDTDLKTIGLSRDVNTLRDNYISQGFTCK